jgi:hypothetical protein
MPGGRRKASPKKSVSNISCHVSRSRTSAAFGRIRIQGKQGSEEKAKYNKDWNQ